MLHISKKLFDQLGFETLLLFRGCDRELRKEVRRWPALLALLAIGGAYSVLSARLTFVPTWLLVSLLFLLGVPAIIFRLKGNHYINHLLLLALCCVVTFSELISIGLLLASLSDKSLSAFSLLQDAGILWGSNIVIFGLWYWQVDGGGPYARSHESCQDYRQQAEMLFPSLTVEEQKARFQEWRPGFMDYLFVAFNTSTAFSPTDTPLLTTRVKILSMIQSIISLVTLAALAARAINIL
jgi:hypothetical protein